MAKSESSEQITFVARVRSFYPEIMIFAIPNGGGRSAREGAKLKSEGVLPGVPDLMIPVQRGPFCGLFIEMKKVSVKKAQKHQAEVIAYLNGEGYKAVVASGCEEAWEIFENYVLRGY